MAGEWSIEAEARRICGCGRCMHFGDRRRRCRRRDIAFGIRAALEHAGGLAEFHDGDGCETAREYRPSPAAPAKAALIVTATRLDGAVTALEEAALEAHAFADHRGSLEACRRLNCNRARAALALARGTTGDAAKERG